MRIIIWNLTAFVVLVGLVSCATSTPYRQSYYQATIADDVYQIYARGNDRTPQHKVYSMGLLRCAEITEIDGYDWFYILDYEVNTQRGYKYFPQIQKMTHLFYTGLGIYIYDYLQKYRSTGFSQYRSNYDCVFVIQLLETEVVENWLEDEFNRNEWENQFKAFCKAFFQETEIPPPPLFEASMIRYFLIIWFKEHYDEDVTDTIPSIRN